jgi:hypothetical protein
VSPGSSRRTGSWTRAPLGRTEPRLIVIATNLALTLALTTGALYTWAHPIVTTGHRYPARRRDELIAPWTLGISAAAMLATTLTTATLYTLTNTPT